MATTLQGPGPEPPPLNREEIRIESATRRCPRRRGEPLTAIDGLSLSVHEREVVAVVGPSGCGKTTLLELVAGLAEPDEGRVSVAGARDRRRACALMPQH